MGGSTSQLPQADRTLPLIALTFQTSDKIKLINADAQVVSAVRQALEQSWNGGLQDERIESGGETIFKLRGTPFSRSSYGDEAISMRRVLCQLLETLRSHHYHLITSADLIQTKDLSTWFFQRHNDAQRPDDSTTITSLVNIVAVAISSSDKLTLVNAPEWMNEELVKAVEPHVQSHENSNGQRAFTVKINGSPWHNSSFSTGITARRILLRVFSRFHGKGYRFLGTCNAKGTADTLFFINDEQRPDFTTQSTYACLSLNSTDCLRLVQFSERQIDAVRCAINTQWPRGLQDDRPHLDMADVYEFKLYGTPWSTSSSSGHEALQCRRLIAVIMQALLGEGLEIVAGLDASRKVNDKGLFILRSCQPVKGVKHLALAALSTDKLAVIDIAANSDQEVDIVRQAIERHYTAGIQAERHTQEFSTTFKVNGNPWTHNSFSNENAVARLTLCHILHRLSVKGFRCVCSVDVSARYGKTEGQEYPLDTDTLFFVQQNGMDHGSDLPPSYRDVMKGEGMFQFS